VEQLSDIEIEEIAQAGGVLEALPVWDTAKGEIRRRMQGIIQRALLGKLESYEEYLANRAEYIALDQMLRLPTEMKEMGAV
jgi:hypothetical protein